MHPTPIADPSTDRATARSRALQMLAWTAVLLTCLYAAYALTIAVQTALSVLDLAPAGRTRSVPALFTLHALTGAICLATGALQFRLVGPVLPRRPQLHRILGRVYILSAVATSLAGLVVAARFDVGPEAKAAFALEGLLWLATTALAYRYARRRQITKHRKWITRSYALTLFIITFSLLQPPLADALPRTTAYTVSVLSATLLNLGIAELINRRRSTTVRRRTHRPQPDGRPTTARTPA